MKWFLLITGLAVLLPFFSSGQNVILYRETFPYPGISGNFPVSTVGWASDIPDNANRLYQNSGGDGAVFAYEGSAATTAFYTSSNLTLSTGAAFPLLILPYIPGLTLSIDIQPYQNPANVSARFAVQMNGNSWFVSANALPVPAMTGSFSTSSNVFNPAASQWNSLTVSGNGTGTMATIGGLVSSNLSGNITGAGLVFIHTGSGGTFNFDNFVISATNVTNLAINSISNGTINISWPGALNVCLQSATNLGDGGWSNNFLTAGQNSINVPVSPSGTFYRLSAFPTGGLQDGDFESGNLAAHWLNSGTAAAASPTSGSAFSGSWSLLQSNTSPYQVQTWQLVTNLPNGYYKLTAMVQNSGGQSACYLGANDKLTSLPISSRWTNTIVRGISVTNGQCLVTIYSSDSAGGDWCRVDFIQLIKDDISYNFLKGGDVSELTYVQRGGGVYYETNGTPTDCLTVLKNHGCNIVRLRLYNDPGNPAYAPSNLLPPGIQSPTNILDLARQAQALGLTNRIDLLLQRLLDERITTCLVWLYF